MICEACYSTTAAGWWVPGLFLGRMWSRLVDGFPDCL